MGAVNLDISDKDLETGQSLKEEREVQAASPASAGLASWWGLTALAARVPLLAFAGSELLPRHEPDRSHPPDVLK